MAAIATFALKPGVWFRRVRLVIVSPDSQRTACLLSGRNSTYRPVQISGTGSTLSQCFAPDSPGLVEASWIWNHCPSPSFLCCLRRQPWQMIRQKRGPSGPVSYQHKRRPRSTLLVSKVLRLARTAQGGRQKCRKLGESGREGVEGRRGFIVVDRHRYTDIEDYLVGLTLGQVRSFDARVRSPHVRSSRPPIVGPRGRGSLPRLPYYYQRERGADKCPASESNSMTRRGTCSTCLPETA